VKHAEKRRTNYVIKWGKCAKSAHTCNCADSLRLKIAVPGYEVTCTLFTDTTADGVGGDDDHTTTFKMLAAISETTPQTSNVNYVRHV